MSGGHVRLQQGPATYTVSAAVTGGQLVEPDGTTGKIKPATAASTKVLGMARGDAQPDGTNPSSPLNVAWARPEVGVVYSPAEVTLTFTGACAFGQPVIAAAAGAAADGGATPVAGTVIGICTEPGGVLAAGPGLVRLRV